MFVSSSHDRLLINDHSKIKGCPTIRVSPTNGPNWTDNTIGYFPTVRCGAALGVHGIDIVWSWLVMRLVRRLFSEQPSVLLCFGLGPARGCLSRLLSCRR